MPEEIKSQTNGNGAAIADYDEIRIRKRDGYYGIVQPIHFFLPDTIAGTANSFTVPFFVADRNYELLQFRIRYVAAASSGTTVMLKRAADGVAVASGDDMLNEGLTLGNATATLHKGVLHEDLTRRVLHTDHVIGLDTSGTITSLEGFMASCLILWWVPPAWRLPTMR